MFVAIDWKNGTTNGEELVLEVGRREAGAPWERRPGREALTVGGPEPAGRICPFCRGTGRCGSCAGLGYREGPTRWFRNPGRFACQACEGTGTCQLCRGTGQVAGGTGSETVP